MFSVLILLMFVTNNYCLSKRISSNNNEQQQQWYASTNSWNFIPSRGNYLTTIPSIETDYHHWNKNKHLDNQFSQSMFVMNHTNVLSSQQARSKSLDLETDMDKDFENDKGRRKHRIKKKKYYQKFMLPLLLAYKLKFFTLIPVMIGGLVLLAGATGLAGFFFALFAAVMGLKSTGHGYH